MKVMRNKFSGKCSCCGKRVPALSGVLWYEDGWQVAHEACRSDLAGSLITAETEFVGAAEKAKAEKAAILVKLGLDFSKQKYVVSQQLAWSDYHEVEVPYRGEGSEEEFKAAIETRAESSSGHLRWSNGRRFLGTDPARKIAKYSESISLCD